MSITFKVALTLVSSLALALALVIGLNLLRFDSSQRDLDTDRAGILLADLAIGAVAAYDVGLPLRDFTPLAELREQARRRSDDLLDILLFDHEGRILQSGDSALEGTTVPNSWTRARRLAAGGVWSLTEDDRLVVGLGLHSSFGADLGALAAVLSRDHQQQNLFAMMRHLGAVGLAVFLSAVAVALPASLLLSRRLRRLVEGIDAAVGGDRDEAPRDQPRGRAAAGLQGLLGDFAERRRRLDAALSEAETSAPGGDPAEPTR